MKTQTAKNERNAPNLRWSELKQKDKEAVIRVANEQPVWARLLLYGETYPGSREETEALLAHNDSLETPLFVETSANTVKMLRYNNAVIRLIAPHGPLQRAWRQEEERLGLDGLDDSLDFIHAAYLRSLQRAEGRPCFPFRKFGVLPPDRQESDGFNMQYWGGLLLFGKALLRGVTLPQFFASLPNRWFGDTALRTLDVKETELAIAAKRPGMHLSNTEMAALRTFAENNAKREAGRFEI